jgi:hypothetical protein
MPMKETHSLRSNIGSKSHRYTNHTSLSLNERGFGCYISRLTTHLLFSSSSIIYLIGGGKQDSKNSIGKISIRTELHVSGLNGLVNVNTSLKEEIAAFSLRSNHYFFELSQVAMD